MTETRTTIGSKLRGCIAFARFSAKYKIAPADLADLLHYARRSFKAGERECNTGPSADAARRRFEALAAKLGYRQVRWPGLWPQIELAWHGWIDLPSI